MKEELKKALNKIGWDMKGIYPNEFIYDHQGNKTPYRVMGDRIEPQVGEFNSLCFHFKGCEVYELKNNDEIVDCVGLQANGNNEVFIQFYNYDLNNSQE